VKHCQFYDQRFVPRENIIFQNLSVTELADDGVSPNFFVFVVFFVFFVFFVSESLKILH